MDVKIISDYITLGQFLKFVGIIDNGAQAKTYLSSHTAMVNGEIDVRRGKKIYPGDVVEVANKQYRVVN